MSEPRKAGKRRCWSCGRMNCDNAADYCYGCKHIVCIECGRLYDHERHGSPHARSPAKVRARRKDKRHASRIAH